MSQRAVILRLRVIQRLLGHDTLRHQRLGAVQSDLSVFQIRLSLVNIGPRDRDFLGTRAVFQFRQPGLQVGQLPFHLVKLGAILVVFQAHQHLAGFHFVALLHADPRHAAHHLGGHLDPVSGHDITCCVQNHARSRRRRTLRVYPRNLHFGRGIELGISQSRNTQQEKQHHAADNPACRPARGRRSALLRAVNLQRFQFRLHDF